METHSEAARDGASPPQIADYPASFVLIGFLASVAAAKLLNTDAAFMVIIGVNAVLFVLWRVAYVVGRKAESPATGASARWDIVRHPFLIIGLNPGICALTFATLNLFVAQFLALGSWLAVGLLWLTEADTDGKAADPLEDGQSRPRRGTENFVAGVSVGLAVATLAHSEASAPYYIALMVLVIAFVSWRAFQARHRRQESGEPISK